MCGLIALMKPQTTIEDCQFMHQALQTLKHRGPDDEQLTFTKHLILGFNRLSIIDLDRGGQPFQTQDKQCQLVFNGEIYNYLELRHQLEKLGFSFETSCEAEVILTLYQLLGLEFMTQLRGMFSLVLYDHTKEQLIAVRDRFGIKPLYYFQENDVLFITSELKPFKLLTLDDSSLQWTALQHYFTFQYIPEPLTCLQHVQLLEAGTYLTFSFEHGLEIKPYATVELLPIHKTSYVLKEQLQQALIQSVQSHLQSDVPVGCFLSGGVDSTIIATCAKAFNDQLKAFTIGFKEEGYSEIQSARLTADMLNLDLTTKEIDAASFMHAAKEAIMYLDSPLADPSSVAIYVIAKEARKQVKVILSGEGADELFGGYRIYREVDALKCFNYVPTCIRQLLLNVSKFIPPGVKGKSFIERGCIPLKDRYIGNAFVFNEKEKEKLLHFYNPNEPFTKVTHPIYETLTHLDPLQQMQMIDIKTWLRGDILMKSDRLTMAHALELRVPFLDQNVLELAKYLTIREKIEGSQTKILLREAFEDFIPPHIFNAPKMGYPVPLKNWFKHELYDQTKELLSSSSCEHLIDSSVALTYLDEHARGKRNHSRKIWSLITFILWYESWMSS